MRAVITLLLFGVGIESVLAAFLKHSNCNVPSSSDSNAYCGISYTVASSSYVSSVPSDQCLYCTDGYEESDCSLSSSPYKAFTDGGSEAGSNCQWRACRGIALTDCLSGWTKTGSSTDGCWPLQSKRNCCEDVDTWKCCVRKSCTEAPLCPSDSTACTNVCNDQYPGSDVSTSTDIRYSSGEGTCTWIG